GISRPPLPWAPPPCGWDRRCSAAAPPPHEPAAATFPTASAFGSLNNAEVIGWPKRGRNIVTLGRSGTEKTGENNEQATHPCRGRRRGLAPDPGGTAPGRAGLRDPSGRNGQ